MSTKIRPLARETVRNIVSGSNGHKKQVYQEMTGGVFVRKSQKT